MLKFLKGKKKKKPDKEKVREVIEHKELMAKFFEEYGMKDLAKDEKRHIEKLKKMI